MPYFASFEIDIISALAGQLLAAFQMLTPEPLTSQALGALERGQGVYKLFHQEALVYVGKADDLPGRLSEHLEKISGRRNISVGDMTFSCLYVHPNWTALAPEKALIDHYKTQPGHCAWNGNGFGPHDPGRKREQTDKPPDGFDAQYPIKNDWIVDRIEPGLWNGRDLLTRFKKDLPYLLRYEVTNSKRWRDGHPAYNSATITVPSANLPARELLMEIAKQLPGWQATIFPSHMILYHESRLYTHGTVVWP